MVTPQRELGIEFSLQADKDLGKDRVPFVSIISTSLSEITELNSYAAFCIKLY